MEIRVKERLIGALILVAVIVLLVPELLSGPHRQQGSNAKDAGAVQTYTIDLAAPGNRAAPAREPDAAPGEPQSPDADSHAGTGTMSVEATPEAGDTPSAEPQVAPEKPATATAPAATESSWAVQLGSFASEENAGRLAKDLKSRGYKAFVSRIDSGSRTRYRVRVGPEQDRARAENLAERLRREGRSAVIVPQP
ncbi:MAG TPA: SPOR domain-containing protein [Steroidobacteraceae bacterium]|nr:SPOR domain-containing protein [Steroidobacteraceae bacterium]